MNAFNIEVEELVQFIFGRRLAMVRPTFNNFTHLSTEIHQTLLILTRNFFVNNDSIRIVTPLKERTFFKVN